MSVHDCRCGRPKEKSWHLLCPTCWAKIPIALQEEVYQAYNKCAGSEWHRIAQTKCIEHLKSLPFGWEVDVEFHPHSGKPNASFHWRGCTEAAAIRKAKLKHNVREIVATRSYTEDQWIAAFGIGRM